MSENHLRDYEADLRIRCVEKDLEPGTFDVVTVTRARRVHQPLWSVPYTGLRSTLDIIRVLLSPPRADDKRLRYPSYIFSNGPATGFFVGLVAWVLRMFYLVPEGCLRLIYVESWARISSLSLSGKLIYRTGIADIFAVQHRAVADRYRVLYVGPLVFNSRRDNS